MGRLPCSCPWAELGPIPQILRGLDSGGLNGSLHEATGRRSSVSRDEGWASGEGWATKERIDCDCDVSLTGSGPALPRRGACGPHRRQARRRAGSRSGHRWRLDLVFELRRGTVSFSVQNVAFRRRFLPASHATRRVQRQGMNLFICNSLDSTLRTALASFYVSDADWYSIGGGILSVIEMFQQ